MELTEVTVNNKSFGKLNGCKVFLTKSLYEKLGKEKTKRDNTPIIDLFKNGRALQGLKHLVELIKESSQEAKIIFTEETTSRGGDNYHINYAEYRQKAQGKFYSLYRTTGLDTAKSYLNIYFPEDFPYDNVTVSEKDFRHADKNFPELIKELSTKAKHKKTLVDQTALVLRTLREEKKILAKDIEALQELQKQSSISYYQQRHDELIERLQKKYPETKGKNSWQTWIYSNSWVFGVNYHAPVQKEKVGFNSIPDYLFPTLDSFIDILEIKKTDAPVLIKDTSHAGSYMWSGVVYFTPGTGPPDKIG